MDEELEEEICDNTIESHKACKDSNDGGFFSFFWELFGY